MSSRGRGFNSRGGGGNSYRGRGGGEWSGSGGSGSRGGFSSSRGGRFNKYSGGGYDSRSKYNNSSGGSDRYGSRGGRGDHSNHYKRPRDQPYSARDDHRSSSETSRKRARNDSYQGEGSSSSQRYPSTYGGSGSSYDTKRPSSSAVYEDKRQSDRYHRNDERHTSASRSYPAPPPPRISEMAPPNQRYMNSNRGRVSQQATNYRGRASTRARGNNFRSRTDLLARKRNLTAIDYRRKLLTSRSRDYIQRVRMTTKMRRSGASRISGSKKEGGGTMKDKDRELAKAINAEFSDEDDEEKNAEEEVWDEEEKVEPEDEEEEEEEEEEEPKEKKVKEGKVKKEKRGNAGQEMGEKDDEKEEEAEVKMENEEDDEVEDDSQEKGEGVESDGLRARGKRFTKLQCPHCSNRSATFKEYSLHLYSGRHNIAMRRIAARHKANIARMRVVQRQEQRRVEEKDEERGTLPSRTMFCQICKLNYRSLKAVHHLSESHRQMKKFLTPFCRICRIQFRSPMLYETHVASLDHIKAMLRKNSDDKKENGEAEGDSSAPEEDDKEVNLDNFMTLDSVGDVDAEDGEESGEKKKKDKADETTSQENEPKKAKTKQMIKVGAEYIKRVEVQFCELCKVYLPRNENSERAVALHCSTRSHLKRYVRDNDDKALRRQAERIHLQTSSTANTKTPEAPAPPVPSKEAPTPQQAPAKDTTTPAPAESSNETPQAPEQNQSTTEPESTQETQPNEDEEDDGDGDKLWDDVDKDLGDILREAEPGKSSDDEDSRYDRFRNTDTKQNKENEQMTTDEENQKLDVKIKVEKPEK
ncbi:golgin subfamily A member 6-like protein 22 isoform X2 [Diachasma alloeum]|uniref:golgin subfamily A member 6-like protein 22 isoform X2 n=1 Tax=Diachasma alloeum TaxID=454923 RepID=UPI0007382DA3|nr:golgin subfamily A member 6-like protein 22 isoform X2 [Diachasma alloeum]